MTAVIIFCLGFIAYSNTFWCSFHFDDTYYIVNNHFIKNIQDLPAIWEFYPCRFITSLSFALNYHWHQLNVVGYHVFNLTVHLACAALVWQFVLLTFSTPAMKANGAGNKITQHAQLVAFLAALIFVVHPLQTQAVTYICQRAASMAALFYLASLIFYIKYRLLQVKGPNLGVGRMYYIFYLLMAVAAMFTKETAITLPLMIVLYEFSFFEPKKNLDWKRLSPFLLTLLIIPLTMVVTNSVNFQEIRHVVQGPSGITPSHYLLTQFRVIMTYLRLVFLPFNQNFDYDYPIFKSVFDLPVLFSLLFLIAVLFWAKGLFLKYRLFSFSIFWFVLTLLPESSVLPQNDVIFEHRLYLPLVGFSIFLVSGVYYLFGKDRIKTAVGVLGIMIFCYFILTYCRNKIWMNEFTLWDDTIQKSPYKARPYNSRGLMYFYKGGYAQAIADYNKSLEINPNIASTYNNRGLAYAHQGNLAQAMSDYRKAIGINPNYADPYNNLGSGYNKQRDFTQAIRYYDKAIELNPDYAEAYNNRGTIYFQQGRRAEALADYNKAIELNPDYADAHYNLGIARSNHE